MFVGCLPSEGRFASRAAVLFFFVLGWLAPFSALADGCFVFKWDKNTDINEPTQKAIIVHDAGREDLLLQVKYEGPLEEFGWLIPIPTLPKVEKGSMEAFYELSELTQRRFGVTATLSAGSEGRRRGESVKVIGTKTVGAYEVAILSAEDSGSLARWLNAHDYSIPEGKAEIIEEYIRERWFFVAAKIHLNKGIAFKTVSSASPKDSDATGKARKIRQKQLRSGELHPLLISFDTPRCIFPLKISAVGDKPSEVSVYVFSSEPLLNKFIFDKACEKLDQQLIEWENTKPQREAARETSRQNLRTLNLAFQMRTTNSTSGTPARRDWSAEDLAKEGQPHAPEESLEPDFYASPEQILQCLRVTANKIPKSAKNLSRLKRKDWYLTKQVWTFSPEEMHDLEFQPAKPAMAKVLSHPAGSGGIAAQLLAQLDSDSTQILTSASKSTNSTERINAAFGFQQLRNQSLAEPLLNLFKDEVPQARLYAVRAASQNWDKRFADPLIALFRDPFSEIRREASGCLAERESAGRSPIYLALLNDAEPNVRLHALQVLSKINPKAISQAALIEALKDSNQDVQSSVLHILWKMDRDAVPRSELLPLLGSSRFEIVTIAFQLLREGKTPSVPASLPASRTKLRASPPETLNISSLEAAPLIMNRLTMARLLGLGVLRRNGDVKAIELSLPLLRDTNSIVRARAFSLIRAVSGQNISDNDPAQWEKWWAENKHSCTPREPVQ
jgi:HEAT repeat protein